MYGKQFTVEILRQSLHKRYDIFTKKQHNFCILSTLTGNRTSAETFQKQIHVLWYTKILKVTKNGVLNIYATAVPLYGSELWIIILQMKRRDKRLLRFSLSKIVSNDKYVISHFKLEIHNSRAHDNEKGRSV